MACEWKNIMLKRNIQSMTLPFVLAFIINAPGLSSAATPLVRPGLIKDAEIVKINGDGWVRFVGEEALKDAVQKQFLTSGDYLRTGNHGKMDILFIDGIQIKVNKRTSLVIKEVGRPGTKKGSLLGLELGEIWSRAKALSEGLNIETPSATAAIRGTDWDLAVDENGTSYLTVLNGTVELHNAHGSITVGQGEYAVTEVGKAPFKTFLIKPKDRIQWVISYPMDVTGDIRFFSHRRNEVVKLIRTVEEKTEKDPSDLRAKLLLAGLYYDLRDKDKSLLLFEDVLKTEPENGRALTFRGLIALYSGETDKASFYFNKAARKLTGRDKTEALLGMAGVYLDIKDIEKALLVLDDIRQSDSSPIVALALSDFHASQGNFRMAAELCSEYSLKYPEDERFPTKLAAFYLLLDEGEKAKNSLEQAIRVNPQYSLAYTVLGRHHYLEGRWKEAREAYQKALELDSKNAVAKNDLGIVITEKGYYDKAGKEFSGAIALEPRNSLLRSNRGMLFNWIEDLKSAVTDYNASLELNPTDYLSIEGLGIVALKEGRTDEAINYLLKAGLMEPGLAEPHIYLAVAYYQKGDTNKALAELGLAESLDPRNPFPHTLAYLIYTDTYRPFEAIKEAKKALGLLPYLKSMTSVENTRSALSNLGSALLGLGMSEWADSYAQESFDQHNASSHFFAAKGYSNIDASLSELIQGLIAEPLAVSSPARYQDLIRKPRNNLSVSYTLGNENNGLHQGNEATLQGYFRQPWETSYILSYSGYDSKGFRENGYSKGHGLIYGIGAKPDYKNGFSIYGWLQSNKSGEPGTSSRPDTNDRNENSLFFLSSAYNHQFGPKNNIWTRFAYRKGTDEFFNPDPFGTGLTDTQISFINYFGLDTAKRFFEKGVYDVTAILGLDFPTFATDSTGNLSGSLGLTPLASGFPDSVDYKLTHFKKVSIEQRSFQSKHLFELDNAHQVTYGLEYTPSVIRTKNIYTDINYAGESGFIDDFFSTAFNGYAFPDLRRSISYSDTSEKRKNFSAYINDRWSLSQGSVLEGGIFFESCKNGVYAYDGIHPRIGLALRLGAKHILRLGFQKWLQPDTYGTLAPVATAGLVVDNSLAQPGSMLKDYQARLESRFTDTLFTRISAERVELQDTYFGKGYTHALSTAINSILTDTIGAFLRYRYAASKNTDSVYYGKPLPLVPEHILTGGFVWVSPLHIKTIISVLYTGQRFDSVTNEYKLQDYLTTDLSAVWEPFKKKMMLSFNLKNIFDAKYETRQGFPAAGRSAYLTVEYRF